MVEKGCYRLSDLRAAGVPKLRYVCSACGRKGEATVDELVERYGIDAGLPTMLFQVAEWIGCERHAERGYNICFLRFRRRGEPS